MDVKRDVARLTSEINILHKQLLCAMEEKDTQSRHHATQVRKLETAIRDLQFANEQFQNSAQTEREKVTDERRKFETQLRKYFPKGINDNPRAKQRISIHRELSPLGVSDIDNPRLVDPIKITDKRIEQLTQQLENESNVSHEIKEQMSTMRAQIAARDAEISRLTMLADQGHSFKGQTLNSLQSQLEQAYVLINELESKLAEKEHVSNDLKVAVKKNKKLMETLQEVPNQKLSQEVEELQQLLASSNAAQEELIKHFEAVCSQPEEMQKALKQKLEKVSFDFNVEMKTNKKLREQNQRLESELEQSNEVRLSLMDDLRTLDAHVLEITSQIPDLISKNHSNEEILKMQHEISHLKDQNQRQSNTIHQNLEIIKNLNYEISDIKLDNDRFIRDSAELKTTNMELQRLRNDVQNTQNVLNETNQVLNQHLAHISRQNKQLQDAEIEKKTLAEQITNLSTDLRSVIKENQLLNAEHQHFLKKTEDQNIEKEEILRKFTMAQEKLNKLESERMQMLSTYKKLVMQQEQKIMPEKMQSLQQENIDLRKKLETTSQNLESANYRIKQLEICDKKVLPKPQI